MKFLVFLGFLTLFTTTSFAQARWINLIKEGEFHVFNDTSHLYVVKKIQTRFDTLVKVANKEKGFFITNPYEPVTVSQQDEVLKIIIYEQKRKRKKIDLVGKACYEYLIK